MENAIFKSVQMPAHIIFIILCFSYALSYGDTIYQGETLSDWELLHSANSTFRLQFFSPDTSKNRYLGIFYNATPVYELRPVWVANRNNPITDASGSLMIDLTDGLLKIFHSKGKFLVSNSSVTTRTTTSATLLDNGNLVLREMNRDGSMNRTLWQSFDYPTDTFLPGMKLGIDFRSGHRWSLTSWVSDEVPASGSFTIGGDPNGTSQLIMWWQGDVYWTSGLWHNGNFNNTPDDLNVAYQIRYVSNDNEKYLMYSVMDNTPSPRFTLSADGVFKSYRPFLFLAYCLSHPPDAGCVMKTYPTCKKGDLWFWSGYAFGDSYIFEDYNLSHFDCAAKCRQNCSCIAYASSTNNGTGCEVWGKDIRLGSSDGSEIPRNIYVYKTRKAKWWIWLIVAVSGTLLLLLITCIFRLKGKKKVKEILTLYEQVDTSTNRGNFSKVNYKDEKVNHIRLFSFDSIEMATNNFSTEKKLGEGGFGPVYKGELLGGQEVAIKRLSRSSGQGLIEFQNEIRLIARLQHNNLVRLLGSCIQGQELILVYEYMPNKSLDHFLFESKKRELLKWTDRMNIIEGVAQGLLYLHKYSRLKIIHRDLKASNILLDQNMNPKISDFGLARIFDAQQSEANTKRIVGTHGYMSPEYAINGVVSTKTDVFSFGVLVLEIVSGKKNRASYDYERPVNLIGLAWELWVDGRALDLMDATLNGPNHKIEAMRCFTVGLLCVQDSPSNRPSMADVVSMLTNESVQLPIPEQPAFFFVSSSQEVEKEATVEKPTTNGMSTSLLEAR